MTVFLLLHTPFAMISFLKMAAYPNNGRRGVISACNVAHSDIVARLGWIGRVVHNDI